MIRGALTVAALGLTLVALGGLWRQPVPRYPVQTTAMMLRLDDDGDGVLSEEEFNRRAPAETPMPMFDLNDSGAIEPFELEQMLLMVDPIWLEQPPM